MMTTKKKTKRAKAKRKNKPYLWADVKAWLMNTAWQNGWNATAETATAEGAFDYVAGMVDRRGKRRTGDKAATIAGKVMAEWKELKREWGKAIDMKKHGAATVLWVDLLALAGSALSQDEHRGRRGK